MSAVLTQTAEFVCQPCGEVFPAEVWHCLVCDSHLSFVDRECRNCHDYSRLTTGFRHYSELERRVRAHLVYTYLLEECFKETDEGLYQVPSEVALLVLVGELASTFDYDLRHVPGFYFSTASGFWKLNVRAGRPKQPEHPAQPGQLLDPYHDARGRIIGCYVRNRPNDSLRGLLTSRGLPLGTPATKPLSFEKGN